MVGAHKIRERELLVDYMFITSEHCNYALRLRLKNDLSTVFRKQKDATKSSVASLSNKTDDDKYNFSIFYDFATFSTIVLKTQKVSGLEILISGKLRRFLSSLVSGFLQHSPSQSMLSFTVMTDKIKYERKNLIILRHTHHPFQSFNLCCTMYLSYVLDQKIKAVLLRNK